MHFYLKKVVSNLITLFVIITATFFMMKCLPGDPFLNESAIPVKILENLKEHYGLNDPLWKQYLHYLKATLCFDLGPSFKYPDRTVNDIIYEGFPVSALLGIEALLIAIPSGIVLGTFGAIFAKSNYNLVFILIITLFTSIPSFIVAALLQYIFAIKLEWLPIARWGGLLHTLLPAFSLALFPLASIAKLLRSSMIDVLASDYIRTARAKGLSEFSILWRHALKNSLLPVISYLGPIVAGLISGTFVIERMFSIPGLGQAWIESIFDRDYTVILGITLFYSVVLLSTMLVVDLAYKFIDPRISHGKS
jgi:oligopeptide transport system permease protein